MHAVYAADAMALTVELVVAETQLPESCEVAEMRWDAACMLRLQHMMYKRCMVGEIV